MIQARLEQIKREAQYAIEQQNTTDLYSQAHRAEVNAKNVLELIRDFALEEVTARGGVDAA